jgi:hypothetical protein
MLVMFFGLWRVESAVVVDVYIEEFRILALARLEFLRLTRRKG